MSNWVGVKYLPEKLGGGFTYFIVSPLFGEDFQFDEHIFQMGWNHQLETPFHAIPIDYRLRSFGFRMATNRTQADIQGLVTAAQQGPTQVAMSDGKYVRLRAVVQNKKGGFGQRVRDKLVSDLMSTTNGMPGDAHTAEEAATSVAMLQVASSTAIAPGTVVPLGARAQLIRSALQPLANFQVSEGLRALPDIVEAIQKTPVWTGGQAGSSWCGCVGAAATFFVVVSTETKKSLKLEVEALELACKQLKAELESEKLRWDHSLKLPSLKLT